MLNKYSKICIDVLTTTAGYIIRLTKQIDGKSQLYVDKHILDRHRISKLVACSVLNKYSKICIDVLTTTAGYIIRLTKQIDGKSYVHKHTTAQYLVNTCKHYRGSHKVVEFIKQFHHLRTAVLAVCY